MLIAPVNSDNEFDPVAMFQGKISNLKIKKKLKVSEARLKLGLFKYLVCFSELNLFLRTVGTAILDSTAQGVSFGY